MYPNSNPESIKEELRGLQIQIDQHLASIAAINRQIQLLIAEYLADRKHWSQDRDA